MTYQKMNDDKWVVAEGSTVHDATQKALARLEATEDEVEVVVERPRRRGLWGLWHWQARVRVRRRPRPEDAETDASDGKTSPAPTPEAHEKPPVRHPTIALRDGQVAVTTPEGEDRHPVLRPGDPGAPVRVWVNGELLEEPRTVTEDDEIRVEVVDEPPETDIRVEVAKDEYSASLSVFLQPGVRYRLLDAPPADDVTVRVVPDGPWPPPIPTVADLEGALAQHGVVFGIAKEALEKLVRELQGDIARGQKPVPVAFGTPMEPTVDDWVEVLFETDARVRADVGEQQTDLLGMYKLSTVQAGDVIAVKRSGSRGQPGRTVTGKTVPVEEPRAVRLEAGAGVAWDDDGRRLLATRGGRPIQRRNVITVHPQHTVRGDVDPSTGHVEFDGDVIVQGNVGDSMRVISRGSISIGNRVSNAVVEAHEGVTIGRGIVKSKVVAGARYARLFQPMVFLQPLTTDVRHLHKAVARRLTEEKVRPDGSDPAAVGRLVKRMLDDEFPGIESRVRQLHDLMREGEKVTRLDHELARLATTLQGTLVGLGPLSLTDAAALAELHEQMQQYVDEFQQEETTVFDVVTGFIDNSEVLAAGKIIVRRGGCAYSRLWAGRGVDMQAGVFRGTTIAVNNGDVTIREAGSRAAAPAQIEIINEGRFRAHKVHPGVTVTIGGQRHTFRNEAQHVRVRLVDGELQVRTDG